VFARGLHASGSFISIAQKKLFIIGGSSLGYTLSKAVRERFPKIIYRENEEELNKRCHSKDGVAFFVLEISSLHNAASPTIPTDSCAASVVRSTLPLMFCVCLSP